MIYKKCKIRPGVPSNLPVRENESGGIYLDPVNTYTKTTVNKLATS